MPWASRRSRICGTAAAASSLLTVKRTNSDPARASALTCATVPSMSAVSVLVMDCTMMGALPPMVTAPTFTARDFLRELMRLFYLARPPSMRTARRQAGQIGIMRAWPQESSIPPGSAACARIAAARCENAFVRRALPAPRRLKRCGWAGRPRAEPAKASRRSRDCRLAEPEIDGARRTTQEALWIRRHGAQRRHRNSGRSSRRDRRGTAQIGVAGQEIGRLTRIVYHARIAIRAVWRASLLIEGPPKAQPPGNAQAHELQSLAISGERSRPR